jgi:hypothetical protein
MANGEPGWAQGLPDGRTIAECSQAIDMLEAVLFHYRRKRASMSSSVRLARNPSPLLAGQKAMREDPERNKAWRHALSLAARRRRHGDIDSESGPHPRADCGVIPSTAARSVASPESHGGARTNLVGR